jgi:hypothetical protein
MIGIRELFLIGIVVLVLYGRSGVLKGERAQTILPWLSPVRRPSSRARSAGRAAPGGSAASLPRSSSKVPLAFLVRGDRWFWFMAFLAATAVAALIIGRTLILSGHVPAQAP